jgi:shikimate kinase
VKGNGNIFLIGPMGSGKTAVGRHLARLLARPFIDSDSEIEQATGADIPLIFEREGEAGFRRRECEAIEKLTARAPIVLATGGGAVLDEGNRDCIGARGWVVFLETSIEQQARRATRARNRPLLQGVDARQRLSALWLIREPLYRGLADYTVVTDNRSVSAVAGDILQAFKAAQSIAQSP